jgi:tetratricopeptide (TPR) repeat protein
LEISGDSFAAYSGRGQVLVEMGEFAEAMADLNRAIELGESTESASVTAYAQSGRALAFAGLGQFDEAAKDFEESIRNCPENSWVHYNHGLVYRKLGKTAEAAACFELSLELDELALTPRKRSSAVAFLAQVRSAESD